MAISTLNNKIIYTGNGSQTTFVYPFQYDVIGDIQVWVYGIGDIIGQRVYNFTASTASGNLTFTYPVSGSPLPAGHKLLLLRSTSLTQNIDLEEQSTVSLETLEKGYDKACLQLQDAQEKLTRAVIYSPVTEGEISGEELAADIVTTKATATQALALAQTVNSALPNKADLVDGKVPLYQLPETFEDVPSDNQSYVRKNKAWSNLTSDLNTINNRLNAAEGIGGYLQAYDFGVDTPTATQLNDYALSQIPSISNPSEIFNGTRVKNTFNNNLWVLANTPNTIPPVFEWINNGLDTVAIATSSSAGVIKGGTADGTLSIDIDGTANVNGFDSLKSSVGSISSTLISKANLVDGKVPLTELPELYGGGTAATTSFEPTATITSTNVQDAIEEVDAKAIGADAKADLDMSNTDYKTQLDSIAEGSLFGARVDKTSNYSAQQAPTDGIVEGYFLNTDSTIFEVFSDNKPNPTTLVLKIDPSGGNAGGMPFSFTVAKGEYWRINLSSTMGKCWFRPLKTF